MLISNRVWLTKRIISIPICMHKKMALNFMVMILSEYSIGNSQYKKEAEVTYIDSFFVRYADQNRVYVTETSIDTVIILSIEYSSIMDSEELHMNHCFLAQNSIYKITFCAETQEEANEWICALKAGIHLTCEPKTTKGIPV